MTSANSTGGELRRLVLVGAGHAHLHTIQRTALFQRRGFDVTVIAPENFWYSGLATGVLGGRYRPEEDQVDVESLVTRGGGCFIRDRVLSIDAVTRTLHLSSGTVRYDVLSLNLGSETRPLPGENGNVFPIKPLHCLWRLRQELEAARAAGERLRVIVAGGGPSGCEVAANIRALAGAEAKITIITSSPTIATSLAPRAALALSKFLQERAISVRTETSIRHVKDGFVETDRGESVPFEFLGNATGLHAPELLSNSGLPVTERGELVVDPFLRSRGDVRVFGGGDCVHFEAAALAKIGVYAVRQAPILFHNLLATLEGRPLRPFQPQRHYLLILNLGDGEGLACWRRFFWRGRAAFMLKDWIDRRFLTRSRQPIEDAGTTRVTCRTLPMP